jgi:hypothetical protein
VASDGTTAQARALLAICTRVQSATEGDAYIAALDDYDAAVEDVARVAALCEAYLAAEDRIATLEGELAAIEIETRTPAVGIMAANASLAACHRIAHWCLLAEGATTGDGGYPITR